MSVLFPALRAMGEGSGEKLFYLTARNTTQAAAEDAIARLRASAPGLALRSVTLTAKEKVCLHPDAEGRPACLPELCPYANGYYDRIKDALSALLDGSGSFDRAALAETAQRFSVCPFELGLDLSEWCDVVIGDYNYLFDPVVHLKRFFDSSGDWLFLIDEAHNLPDRARAMYSASFSKSGLTDAKRALGKGRSRLKSALTKADKAFLEARHPAGAAAHPGSGRPLPRPDQSSAGKRRTCTGAARAGLRTGRNRICTRITCRIAGSAACRSGRIAELAGSKPGCRCSSSAAGAVLCDTGHYPRRRAVRQPFYHPADCTRQ